MIAAAPVYEVPHDDRASNVRILVVGVGNMLRQDDAFGIAVVQHLAVMDDLPAGMFLLETGIAGVRMVQELMGGYDALIIVDAMVRNDEAGKVVVLEAEVPDPRDLPFDQRNEFLADMHFTNPTRAMMLAKAIGKLPNKTYIVTCEPVRYDDFEMDMSDEVKAAASLAARKIIELVKQLNREQSEHESVTSHDESGRS